MSTTFSESGAKYGWLRSEIGRLKPAESAGRRELFWTTDEERLGVARDQRGRIEIFIAGPELDTRSNIIAANLSHDTWLRKDADPLVASRLLLPAAAHFDAIAAFLCVELLDNGVVADALSGFRRTEPVVEMAIQRSRMQGEVLIGLCGELLVLRSLMELSPAERLLDVLNAWHGHQRSSRDFQLGGVGLEVKTTRGSTSTHRVQGVRQVERGHAVDGTSESSFFMMSIGVEEVEPDGPLTNSWTLPGLVDDLLGIVAEWPLPGTEQLTTGLLDRIRAYGSGEGEGYDHEEMKHRAAFSQPWHTAFVRSYDMDDPNINVLHSEDLAPFTMVETSSVAFTLSLPRRVDGDLNPTVGLNQSLEVLIDRAW